MGYTDFVKGVNRRYSYLFYPANEKWLKCLGCWDNNICRCLDDIQLRAMYLLCSHYSRKEVEYKNNFSNAMNSLYCMSFDFEPQLAADCFTICRHKRDFPIICHSRDMLNWDSEKELLEFTCDYNKWLSFSSLCLLTVNRDIALSRNDILQIYFSLDYKAFEKYISDFCAFFKNNTLNEKHKNIIFAHLSLIENVLNCYKGQECYIISKYIWKVFDEPFFQDNYGCTDNSNVIKKKFQNQFGESIKCIYNLKNNTMMMLFELLRDIIQVGLYDHSICYNSFCNILSYIRTLLKKGRKSSLMKTFAKEVRKLANDVDGSLLHILDT